ncbi:MAG: hypothetical protein AABY74_00820 [Planctomycetota bacterium]|jgi:hypothetical protein
MTRFIALFILSYIVYYLIKNKLRRYTAKTKRQPSWGEKPETVQIRLKEIAYVVYSANGDGDTCDLCAALDGRHFLPGHPMLNSIRPPHPACNGHKGCRCTLTYVTRDEEGSKEIVAYLGKRGGVCDKQAIKGVLAHGQR